MFIWNERYDTKAKLEISIAVNRPQRQTIDGWYGKYKKQRNTCIKGPKVVYILFFFMFAHFSLSPSISFWLSLVCVCALCILARIPYTLIRFSECVCAHYNRILSKVFVVMTSWMLHSTRLISLYSHQYQCKSIKLPICKVPWLIWSMTFKMCHKSMIGWFIDQFICKM